LFDRECHGRAAPCRHAGCPTQGAAPVNLSVQAGTRPAAPRARPPPVLSLLSRSPRLGRDRHEPHGPLGGPQRGTTCSLGGAALRPGAGLVEEDQRDPRYARSWGCPRHVVRVALAGDVRHPAGGNPRSVNARRFAFARSDERRQLVVGRRPARRGARRCGPGPRSCWAGPRRRGPPPPQLRVCGTSGRCRRGTWRSGRGRRSGSQALGGSVDGQVVLEAPQLGRLASARFDARRGLLEHRLLAPLRPPRGLVAEPPSASRRRRVLSSSPSVSVCANGGAWTRRRARAGMLMLGEMSCRAARCRGR
jgi:hypothetical protein